MIFKITDQNSSQLSEKTDADLVQAIQLRSIQSSQQEIRELYKRYSVDVFRMTCSLYDASPEGRKNAEDLFQEAWRKALERIGKFDIHSPNTFGAWVKGFADNLFLEDHRRLLKGKKMTQDLSIFSEALEDPDAPDELNEVLDGGAIKKELLLSALAVLSAREKEILVEWYRTFDRDDPGGEAHANNLRRLSEKYGIQPESIRKIKQRAVAKIRASLKI